MNEENNKTKLNLIKAELWAIVYAARYIEKLHNSSWATTMADLAVQELKDRIDFGFKCR